VRAAGSPEMGVADRTGIGAGDGPGVAEAGQLPFQWVAADAHYGMNPTLLDGVAGLGKCYCAEVPQTQRTSAGGGEEPPARPRPAGSATDRTACGPPEHGKRKKCSSSARH